MTSLWPTLTVRDARASLVFYTQHLGLRQDFIEEDEDGVAWMGSVEVGSTVIMFETAAPGQNLQADHGRRSGVSLTILLDEGANIDGLYAALQASGDFVCAAIGDRPWGNRDFGVRDPDGYHLIIAQALSPS